MQYEVSEVIVVEGVSDRRAVLNAVTANVLDTGGLGRIDACLPALAKAAGTQGAIVFTDSDAQGRRIRARLRSAIRTPMKDAVLPVLEGMKRACVEDASPEEIVCALRAAGVELREARIPESAPFDPAP